LINEALGKGLLSYLSSCKELEVLDLSECTLSRHRKKIPKTEIKEKTQTFIPIFPKLKSLILNSCDCIGWTEMMILAKSAPKLEVLDLGSWGRAWERVDCFSQEKGDKLLRTLGKSCPNLQKLFIEYSGAAGVTTKGLQKLLKGCPNVKELNLMFAMLWRNIDSVLDCIAQLCPKIEFLAFRDVDANGASLSHFMKSCNNLKTFRLYDCDGIWADSFYILAANAPATLEHLDLRGCALSVHDYQQIQDTLAKRGKCHLICEYSM